MPEADNPIVPRHLVHSLEVVRFPAGSARSDDRVAVEEPLEIRIGGEPVAVTMRTPGHDEELALGFCITEGLQPVVASVPDDLPANTVEVEAHGFDPERLRRHFYTSSSCGVCGKGAIEAVEVSAPRIESQLEVRFDVVASLPERLLEAQRAFAVTGGLHATGLFSPDGELLCVHEDVGRHNAMDDDTYVERPGRTCPVDVAFADVDPTNDAALVVPGGRAPEFIRVDPDVPRIVEHFFAEDKPVGTPCHGPQVPAALGLLRGRRSSGFPPLAPDIELAGGEYVDGAAVVDGNIVFCRGWGDLAEWSRAFLECLDRVAVQA